MASMFVELQTPLSEYSLVCRGCLAESGEMKNIREWGLTEDFCRLTDVLLSSSGGISELLCTACEDALMTCKRFRTQCQQADVVLRNIAKKKAEESNTEMPSSNGVTYTFDQHQLSFAITAPDPQAKIILPCPYECKENYIKKKDLLLHLIKKHNMTKEFMIDAKYFCTEDNCAYNQNTGKKWFANRKFLNQHHNKVHKRKIFHCDKCGKDFSLMTDYNRHFKTCSFVFKCDICSLTYNCSEKLMVHLLRHHPELHRQYKNARKAERIKQPDLKRSKTDDKYDYIYDSPKRSFATQTLDNIKNDVALPSWQNAPKNYTFTKTDEISTQTVFEDLLSLKSQSEDDSLLFSESVSLSDIQTQTFHSFNNRSHKETLTDVTDINKETQTCVCKSTNEVSKSQFAIFDGINNTNLTSTQTQTNFRSNISDVLLGYNSAETQTYFDDSL